MEQMSLMEKKEIIAKSFGFVQDSYYTATEKMYQKNLESTIRRF